jgi:hypothetical protein
MDYTGAIGDIMMYPLVVDLTGSVFAYPVAWIVSLRLWLRVHASADRSLHYTPSTLTLDDRFWASCSPPIKFLQALIEKYYNMASLVSSYVEYRMLAFIVLK